MQLPEKGKMKVVDGAAIGAFVRAKMPLIVVVAPLWALVQAVGEALWSGAVLFLMIPVVIMVASVTRREAAARMLILPRRAALRMVAGYLVPLVLAGGVLRAAGRSIGERWGGTWGCCSGLWRRWGWRSGRGGWRGGCMGGGGRMGNDESRMMKD